MNIFAQAQQSRGPPNVVLGVGAVLSDPGEEMMSRVHARGLWAELAHMQGCCGWREVDERQTWMDGKG